MPQAKLEHPLAPLGYVKPPHWLWRMSPRMYVAADRLKDAFLILTGGLTLHRAWQAGHDHGTKMEYKRAVVNGGR